MAQGNEKIRILLAPAEPDLSRRVEQLLQKDGRFTVVGSTTNGEQAWQMFQQYLPALTVLDSELPYLDGLVLSARIRAEKGREAGILLISSFMGAQIFGECELLKIDALMRKPLRPAALYERICLLEKCMRQEDAFRQRVAQILREIGMAEGTKGYQYTLWVICYYRKVRGAGITKEIYPIVAKELNTEQNKVERNMRYAISRVWEQCDPKILEKYFGSERVKQCKSIGNRAFCAALINYLKQEEKLW